MHSAQLPSSSTPPQTGYVLFHFRYKKKSPNKLGCTSVKLLVLLEFAKALLDFIIKKKIEFFFQIGKGKYELGLGKIIIFISILTQFTKSNYVLATIGYVASIMR